MNGLKICYITSEVAPFTPSGGMASVSKLLPVALKDMEKDIRLMMPKYKAINERKYVLREVIRLREVKVELAEDVKYASGKTAFLPNSKVHVYFLSIPEYFNKKGVYGDPYSGKTYSDNAERFAYFCKSALETLKLLFWQPDIIHCSDWSTALVPFYLKTHYKDDPFFKNTRTVLTVHNFDKQGDFPLETASRLDIPEAYVAADKELNLNGNLNFLKGGFSFADKINTVSECLLKTVQKDSKAACGLQEVIAKRKEDLVSIRMGVDYSTWNSTLDKYLEVNYDLDSLNKKKQNKIVLQEEFGFEINGDLPLVVFLSELTKNRGAQLVYEALDALMEQELQVLVVGTGNANWVTKFKKIADKKLDKLNYIERIDRRLTHLIMGGADMLLFPAQKDVHDSNYLRCLRYGTVPVVHQVGRFADSIVHFDAESGEGNGFCFGEYSQSAFLAAIQNALEVFENDEAWQQLQINGMKADFSWKYSAEKYLKLYEAALSK